MFRQERENKMKCEKNVVFIDENEVEIDGSWLVEEQSALIGWFGRVTTKNCREWKEFLLSANKYEICKE